MGISRMQGTAAFIEYVGEKKVKKNSCKNCKGYFDGVCKTRKIVIEYGDNSGKLCKEFDPICVAAEKGKKNNYKTHSRANEKLKGDINPKTVIDTIHTINKSRNKANPNTVVVTLGCIVIFQEVQLEKEKFEFEVSRGKVTDKFINCIINKGIGSQFSYEGVQYKILSIKQSK